ncbi:hypothetical protein E9531_13165 [Lampropedia puyangensis]|uniref:Uncharacterized protein n=1 Tax=Lampropedia puyangensis TaxID=1330072 RepID=A0A4S8EX04_9BURK|nr:hypothetical protein E9531_13165 [Lampropedia puyangensis]
MRSRWLAPLLLALSLHGMALPSAWAQSEASGDLSVLPLASIVVTGSVASSAASEVADASAELAVSGAQWTVTAIETSAKGTVLVLQRTSDGVRISIALAADAVQGVAYSVGSVLTTAVISTGVVLSVSGEVLAFIPNAVGNALIYNERL